MKYHRRQGAREPMRACRGKVDEAEAMTHVEKQICEILIMITTKCVGLNTLCPMCVV
jgi:hypothetical protein